MTPTNVAPIDNPEAPCFAEIVAPKLKIDTLLYKGKTLPASARLERRIIANLIGYMAYNGWSVKSLDDGEEYNDVATMVEAMELIFNLDECRLSFGREFEGRSVDHSVLLILGNGIDLLADWTYSKGDADKFNEVMSGFDVEAFS